VYCWFDWERVLIIACFAWWPPCVADADIIFSSSGFFFLYLSSSFPRQGSQSGCLPYFYTWCGLSSNLGCRSEVCCTRLARNTGRKNDAKNRHLGTIAQLCRAISSQQRHISTIGKKLLSINTSPHVLVIWYVNFGLLTAEIGSVVWGTPAVQMSTGFASWQRYCTASSSGR